MYKSGVGACQVNGFSLENVTHDEAANALKNTQDFVRLVIAKAAPLPLSSGPMSIMSPRRRVPPFTGLCPSQQTAVSSNYNCF